jgi:hypothetical protein
MRGCGWVDFSVTPAKAGVQAVNNQKPPLGRLFLDGYHLLCDDARMYFEILGEITQVETFATSSGIREIDRLRKLYGKGRWRKRKGIAKVKLSDGSVHVAEIHWYEATGVGKKEFKIKRLLENLL